MVHFDDDSLLVTLPIRFVRKRVFSRRNREVLLIVVITALYSSAIFRQIDDSSVQRTGHCWFEVRFLPQVRLVLVRVGIVRYAGAVVIGLYVRRCVEVVRVVVLPVEL